MVDHKSVDGSPLYQRQIATCNDELMHQVWDGTPWMVTAYTGSIKNHGRFGEIMRWCRDQFGPEAFPIHGVPGQWQSGGATVMGWTWMGFASEAMMQQFVDAWGSAVTDNANPAGGAQ